MGRSSYMFQGVDKHGRMSNVWVYLYLDGLVHVKLMRGGIYVYDSLSLHG